MAYPRSYRHDDWLVLVGEIVEIRHNCRFICQGRVDAAMPDSSILWIAADFIRSRTLYSKSDGYEAWIIPRYLQTSAS
jgi:hypothetical protein